MIDVPSTMISGDCNYQFLKRNYRYNHGKIHSKIVSISIESQHIKCTEISCDIYMYRLYMKIMSFFIPDAPVII